MTNPENNTKSSVKKNNLVVKYFQKIPTAHLKNYDYHYIKVIMLKIDLKHL